MSIEVNERPLVTFALFAYNQEKFIREAVEGAFAQTYSPLEIILSDDCSQDRTFEIMQEMAMAYHGPHKIILNRNPKNLGFGGHVNVVLEMAQGELIVMAAGDDVSLAERTKVLTEAWLSANRPSGIASGAITIDEQGQRLGARPAAPFACRHKGNLISPSELIGLFLERKLHRRPFGLLGCSAAWSKTDWNVFGKINEGVTNEDVVLSFRGGLRGGLCVINQELVKYRFHQHNAVSRKNPEQASFSYYKLEALRLAQNSKGFYAAGLTFRGDLSVAKEKLGFNPKLLKDLEKSIDSQMAGDAVRQKWWNLGFFSKLRYWNCSPYVSWRHRVFSLFGIEIYSLHRWFIDRIKCLHKASE